MPLTAGNAIGLWVQLYYVRGSVLSPPPPGAQLIPAMMMMMMMMRRAGVV
jgi:hypothetical protein